MGCYWAAMCKRKELENFLIPYTNTNSNRLKTEIQDLEHKTLIKKIDSKLFEISFSIFFFLISLSATKARKAKINKGELIKVQSFSTVKEAINKMEREFPPFLLNGKRYLQMICLIMG